MGSEARLLLRAPLGVVEVEQKRPLNHVGERLRASLAEEALQDGGDALRWGGAGGEREDDARRLGPGGEVLATWASIRLFGSLARRPRPPSEGSEETTVPTATPSYHPMPPEPSERLAAACFRAGGHRLGYLGVLRAARGLRLRDQERRLYPQPHPATTQCLRSQWFG